jgi:hypothetical protein
MVQWSLDGTLSLGVHADPLHRRGDAGPYGPYVDLHLGPVVVSLGYHPGRANDWALHSQGGIMRAEHR